MGKFIVKIEDLYFEWSTIVDAPITYGMTLKELKEYIKTYYGVFEYDRLQERLLRVEKNGTSALDRTLDDLISCNRAGKNEKRLTKNEIYKLYGKNND